MQPHSKVCSLCKQEKSLGEFCKNKSRPDGLNGHCRQCCQVYYLARKPEGKRRIVKVTKYKSFYESMISNVAIGLPNECWEWTGHKTVDGYGNLHFDGKSYRAHRIAYLLHYGIEPGNLHVCHHCDNPSCVNPYHLFLGTDADNMRDMYEKGRDNHPGMQGESHPLSRLTERDVREIRKLRDKGLTLTEIGNKFHVSFQMVSRICNRKGWKHIS